jgi:hypothetical protein
MFYAHKLRTLIAITLLGDLSFSLITLLIFIHYLYISKILSIPQTINSYLPPSLFSHSLYTLHNNISHCFSLHIYPPILLSQISPLNNSLNLYLKVSSYISKTQNI